MARRSRTLGSPLADVGSPLVDVGSPLVDLSLPLHVSLDSPKPLVFEDDEADRQKDKTAQSNSANPSHKNATPNATISNGTMSVFGSTGTFGKVPTKCAVTMIDFKHKDWAENKTERMVVLYKPKQNSKPTEAIIVEGIRKLSPPKAWLVLLSVTSTESFTVQPIRSLESNTSKRMCTPRQWKKIQTSKAIFYQEYAPTLQANVSSVLVVMYVLVFLESQSRRNPVERRNKSAKPEARGRGAKLLAVAAASREKGQPRYPMRSEPKQLDVSQLRAELEEHMEAKLRTQIQEQMEQQKQYNQDHIERKLRELQAGFKACSVCFHSCIK
jgi:hypothetical protein